jgi:integrative and conjugative element protein (TIGR02256 family)
LIRFQAESSPVIEVSTAALSRINALSLESSDSETGGILVGFNSGKDIQIVDASDPGPNAQRSLAHCLRDTAHCREFLANSFQKSGADYVGEWHSHVAAPGRLSLGDLGTLAGIFVDPDYNFASFAVILVVLRKGQPELLIYVAERDESQRNRLFVKQLYRGKFPIITPIG